ncbi:UNVERIFIED_CONTAM: hypothetical protein HDU68_006698, partial [Siphonaria sp. JEL0065]
MSDKSVRVLITELETLRPSDIAKVKEERSAIKYIEENASVCAPRKLTHIPEKPTTIERMMSAASAMSGWASPRTKYEPAKIESAFRNGATKLTSEQAPKFQNLPQAIMTQILSYTVNPLCNETILLHWNSQRRLLCLIGGLAKSLKKALPKALEKVDERDVYDITRKKSQFAGLQFKRRLHLRVTIIQSNKHVAHRIFGADMLPFELTPSETIYTSPEQYFRPSRLPSLTRGPSIFCISTTYNVSKTDINSSHQAHLDLDFEMDSTFHKASLPITLTDDVVRIARLENLSLSYR